LFCIAVVVCNENEHYADRIFMNEGNRINSHSFIRLLNLMLRDCSKKLTLTIFFRKRFHWKYDWFSCHFYLPLFLINFTFLSNLHFCDYIFQFLIPRQTLFYILTAALSTHSLTVLYVDNVSKITYFVMKFLLLAETFWKHLAVRNILPLTNVMNDACLSHLCWGKYVQIIFVQVR
jgi:hypothetical protein